MGLGLAKRPGRDNRGAECGSLAPSSGYVVGGQGSQQPLRFNIFESPSPSASAFVSVWICVSLSASKFLLLIRRWLSGKESACQCRRPKRRGCDLCIGKDPCRRKWEPNLVFLSGKFHGLRSLVGHSPWGHKELDMTEHTHIG